MDSTRHLAIEASTEKMHIIACKWAAYLPQPPEND